MNKPFKTGEPSPGCPDDKGQFLKEVFPVLRRRSALLMDAMGGPVAAVGGKNA